jgi:NADH-quinone oxidoreductase subunit N
MIATMPTVADLAPLVPELVLVGAAFLLLMVDLFVDEGRRIVTHVGAVAALALVAALVASGVGGQGTVLGGMFVRDVAADVLKVAILVTSALSMLYLGLELLALCSYALVAIDRDSPLASESGIKYFILGSLASGLLLYGMSLVYGATGSLDLQVIARAASEGTGQGMLLLTGVVFMLAGVAFKFGGAPFHMWLPDVYTGAPTPVTMFVGSAPKLASFAMAYRLFEVGAGGLDDRWRMMFAVVAVASLAIGNLAAMVQSNFKRMLAYSTVSHVGFLFIGIAGGGEAGFAAAMFYAISYALMAVAAFGTIVVLASRGFEADRIDDYRGLNARDPWMAGLVLCVMASLAGLPPFLGFWAKLAVLRAALDGGMLWLALVGVVFAVVGAFYYLRVVKAMYFDAPDADTAIGTPSRPLRMVFGVNALSLLALGLAWDPLMALCQRAFAG